MASALLGLALVPGGCRAYHDPANPPRQILAPKTEIFLDASPRLAIVPAGFAYFDERNGTGQRLSGDPALAIADGAWTALPKEVQSLRVEVHVCRDQTGVPIKRHITVLRPVATPDVNDHYIEELATWRFAPYLVDRQPRPTCSVVAFDHARESDPPASMVEGRRIAGEKNILLGPTTLQWMREHGVQLLELRIKLCLDERGVPMSMRITFPRGVTKQVTEHYWKIIKEWRYSPYLVNGKPVNVCTTILYRYSLR